MAKRARPPRPTPDQSDRNRSRKLRARTPDQYDRQWEWNSRDPEFGPWYPRKVLKPPRPASMDAKPLRRVPVPRSRRDPARRSKPLGRAPTESRPSHYA